MWRRISWRDIPSEYSACESAPPSCLSPFDIRIFWFSWWRRRQRRSLCRSQNRWRRRWNFVGTSRSNTAGWPGTRAFRTAWTWTRSPKRFRATPSLISNNAFPNMRATNPIWKQLQLNLSGLVCAERRRGQKLVIPGNGDPTVSYGGKRQCRLILMGRYRIVRGLVCPNLAQWRFQTRLDHEGYVRRLRDQRRFAPLDCY